MPPKCNAQSQRTAARAYIQPFDEIEKIMKKYYYSLHDEWQGPFMRNEKHRFNLTDETLIWYPELCTDQKVSLPSLYFCKKNSKKI